MRPPRLVGRTDRAIISCTSVRMTRIMACPALVKAPEELAAFDSSRASLWAAHANERDSRQGGKQLRPQSSESRLGHCHKSGFRATVCAGAGESFCSESCPSSRHRGLTWNSWRPDAFDPVRLRRLPLRQAVAGHFVLRRLHRHWGSSEPCARVNPALDPRARIQAHFPKQPHSSFRPVLPLIPAWPGPSQNLTRRMRIGR